MNVSVPWGILRKIFAHNDNTDQVKCWALVQLMGWKDKKYPLPILQVPHIVLLDELLSKNSFIIIPISKIIQKVQIIQDHTINNPNIFWINWYLLMGKYKYPLSHQTQILKQCGY